jgi:hypothetical protein
LFNKSVVEGRALAYEEESVGKTLMTDALILGSAITALVMGAQFAGQPHPFMGALALINAGTALFLCVVVRPLLQGKTTRYPNLAHASLLLLICSWSVALWIEYLQVTHLTSALTGAITWTVAGAIYSADLLAARLRPAPAAAPSSDALEPVGAGR